MRSALLAVLTRLLFPLEDEDLGVQHEHFRQRLFELNCRPRSTRWRTASTHSWGICATRFLPWTMKVSDQRGRPWPSAQWQDGLPQRRGVRASAPGRASEGRLRRETSCRLRREDGWREGRRVRVSFYSVCKYTRR